MSIIISGPQGCGKSRRAAELAAHFGLKSIIHEWQPGDLLPDDALALTNVPGVSGAVAFADAMALIVDDIEFDLCDKEHLLALQAFTQHLLDSVDRYGEPVPHAVMGVKSCGDGQGWNAPLGVVKGSTAMLKLDFMVPLEFSQYLNRFCGEAGA